MRISRSIGVLAAAAATLALAACGSGSAGTDTTSEAASDAATDSAETTGGDSGVFPVTVTHAYGTTTIDAEPERVATVGWSNQEAALALGVVPVIMEKATWGDDDDDGVLPWVEEKLTELGAETPDLYDATDGIDFEAIADADPDVILAAYSGLSKDDYETLSQIAPVVAFPLLRPQRPVQRRLLQRRRPARPVPQRAGRLHGPDGGRGCRNGGVLLLDQRRGGGGAERPRRHRHVRDR